MIKKISIKLEYDDGSKNIYEGTVSSFSKNFNKRLSVALTKLLKEINK